MQGVAFVWGALPSPSFVGYAPFQVGELRYYCLAQKHSMNCIMVLLLLLLSPLTGFGQESRPLPAPTDSLRTVRLGEVVVTATQPNAPGTHSVIGRDAIRHIQAADLSDLMQLLPGTLTRNPNLNTPALFTVRSATYENQTNALGTSIIVDGLRMNNNTNMQQIGLSERGSLMNSTALTGFDVRQLAPTSIESVEVIRGVPSARYGDVTSGVVLVNSKAGVQPFTAALRMTATEKLASAGKGFRVGSGNDPTDDSRSSTLYLGAEYALSTQDPRLPERAFQRIALQAAYAKDFDAATLRLHLRGYYLQDKDEQGPNTIDGEFEKTLNRGFSFSAGGQWQVRLPWLSTLEYRAGLTYARQENSASTYHSSTQQVTTYTQQAGEQVALFLPPNYFSRLSVEGRPLTAEASLTAHVRGQLTDGLYHHFQLGTEASTEGNRGQGIAFDPLAPPAALIGTRNRSYRDLPFVHSLAAYTEEQLTLRTAGGRRTELQAGIRLSGQQLPGVASYRPAFDPRLNLRQVLIEDANRHLSLRLGWGRMHKLPLLAYLYPDVAYTDKNCFTYNDSENSQQLAVMHTYITNRTANPDLRLPVNRKWELGVHLRLGGITADVVYFRERLTDGFSTATQAEPFAYRRYDPLLDKAQRPELTPDGVMNNGQPVPYIVRNDFATYLRPENGITQRKQGVEYTFDLGHFRPLHSSLLVSGGYLEVREASNALTAWQPGIEVNGRAYPYVGLYEADAFASNGQVWSQLNSRFQCITQLPRIGLVASVTLQAVWMDCQRRGMESNYNNPVYVVDESGNRLDLDPLTDTEHRKRLNPVYYLDTDGVRRPFTPEMATDPRYSDLVMDAGRPTVFQQDSYRPYFLLNLRVTKEIGRHVSVAFCANNLTKTQPKRYTDSAQQYTILNPNLYYGAELTVRF